MTLKVLFNTVSKAICHPRAGLPYWGRLGSHALKTAKLVDKTRGKVLEGDQVLSFEEFVKRNVEALSEYCEDPLIQEKYQGNEELVKSGYEGYCKSMYAGYLLDRQGGNISRMI